MPQGKQSQGTVSICLSLSLSCVNISMSLPLSLSFPLSLPVFLSVSISILPVSAYTYVKYVLSIFCCCSAAWVFSEEWVELYHIYISKYLHSPVWSQTSDSPA